MLFQNVIRHTIYLLAEAERDAALQQRLRGEVGGADRISNAPASHRVAIHRSHARKPVSTPNSAGNHSQQPPPELKMKDRDVPRSSQLHRDERDF